MEEKTPTSALQELCDQEKVAKPTFECIPDESDPKMFVYVVEAFDIFARGSGRSKQLAKHDACANLIGVLAKTERYKYKLAALPQTPRPKPLQVTADADAIGTLINFCEQRGWPMPKYIEMPASGEPHRREFTYHCQLSHLQSIGKGLTKKGARQTAAQEMLSLVKNMSENENRNQKQITPVETEPIEETFRTYRELKRSDIKPSTVRIRDRHNYFLRLPNDDRKAAYQILKSTSAAIGTNKDVVDLVCKALKLRYEIKDVPGHVGKNKIFVLVGDFDCVISDKEPILYDRIIRYFKTMMF